jgi:hypothetical protein
MILLLIFQQKRTCKNVNNNIIVTYEKRFCCDLIYTYIYDICNERESLFVTYSYTDMRAFLV